MTEELKTYEDARDWLYSLKNRGSTYGIERMERFAERLGNPQRSYPVIHIAGTNGKGSTAAMLESIFRAHGYKTGLSTSPHLVRQGERIQVNRQITTEARILEYTRRLKAIGEEIALEDPEMHPSFFEFMTGMAFLRFQEEEVDIALVEVGLGGRLDATNVVEPEVSVITSIGLDHCEILGDTLDRIAREKGGIIKPGCPVVVGDLPEEAMKAVDEICDERGCDLIGIGERFGEGREDCPETNLAGGYQRLNAAIALTVAEQVQQKFNLDLSLCRSALKNVNWPGRWEERDLVHRKIIFDVSHNSEGARWLEESLSALVESGSPAPDIVMGVMGEYRARSLVPVVARYARSLTFVQPEQSRASSFDELERWVPEDFSGPVERSSVADLFPEKGVCVLDRPSDRPVLVTGSIYLIGEIWERFLEDAPVGQGLLQDF